MVRVKICGITNLEDARASIAAGADALGFNFYRRSPRYISPQSARRIIEELPESVLCVGVFVNEDTPETLLRLARESGVGAVQLHGDESPEYARACREFPVIKALRAGRDFNAADVARYETSAVLLDAFNPKLRGGTGETFDWTVAASARPLVRQLYLAGGLTPANVAAAISIVEPYAVDACSGVESAPGRKSAALVEAFIAAVRAASRVSLTENENKT